MCENSDGEIIIELQFFPEKDYFHFILYGISKLITEYISEKDRYEIVKKVCSINIVYFDMVMVAIMYITVKWNSG